MWCFFIGDVMCKRKRWTKNELEYLDQYAAIMTRADMGRVLGRSKRSVDFQCYKRNLSRRWPSRAETLKTYSSAPNESGCILYLGYIHPLGYGKIWEGHRQAFMAHRVAWEVAHG